MQPESAKFLEDIREAAQTILQATGGRALRRLDERDPKTASRITECRRIIGFRNVLIHGYSVVSNERVWRTVQEDVPNLLAEVEGLLGS